MEWKSSVLCDLKSITIHFSNKKSSVIHQLCLLITRTEVRLGEFWLKEAPERRLRGRNVSVTSRFFNVSKQFSPRLVILLTANWRKMISQVHVRCRSALMLRGAGSQHVRAVSESDGSPPLSLPEWWITESCPPLHHRMNSVISCLPGLPGSHL